MNHAEADAPGSELRGIASRLARILKASNDGYWEWNVASDALWMSARCSEILGMPTVQELAPLAAMRSSIHPDDVGLLETAAKAIGGREHGDSYRVEHRFIRPADGREIWVDVRGTATRRDDAGAATQISGVLTDVTERKRSEDDLRRFQLISENTRDIILFLRRDNGRILAVNAAAEAAYGYTRDELLGMSIRDIRAADTREKIASEMARADVETILFETIHRRKDGTAFPVEVSSRGATIGGVRTLISIIRDITERVRAQEATASAALFPIEDPAPVMRVNRDGKILFANSAAERLLRYWGAAVGSTAPPAIREVVRSATESGERYEQETLCDGREFSFLIAPIAAAGYANLYGHDVTERNQAQRTLKESKDRQELLAHVVLRLLESEDPRTVVEDLAREVMRQLDCDVFFNYLVADDASRLRLNAFAGIPAEAAQEIEWLEFGSAVCGCVARDQARIIAECIPETRDPRTRLVASFGIQSYACHPLVAGGRLIGTLSFGSRTKSRFRAEDLDVMRTVTNHIAIALERVRARTLLAESEERYRAIARSIPQGGVWVVDAELRYRLVEGDLPRALDVNPSRIIGRTVGEVLSGPLRSAVEQRFRDALAGKAASDETEARGRSLWSQFVPLRDEDGRITRAMALTLDVTERKRLERRLRESQRMESVALLAGGIAHDFNNLLVGVIGNVSLAMDMCGDSSTLMPVLRSALQAGENAARLTREMLAYSGRGKFVVEPVNVSELASGVANLVRSSIPNEVTIAFDLDDTAPSIQADVTQIQQIVMNLVINAAEAIGNRAGSISIRIRQAALDEASIAESWPDFELAPGVYAVVEVADTGHGMDAATLARIFDPFFTTKFTGRGLGLAAVLGIVRGHKGGIRVVSAPGKGSTFTLVFPAGAPVADAKIPERTTGSESSSGESILVVDDEEIVLRTAGVALSRRGYHVKTAASGAEALDIVRSGVALDLMVLDLSMPRMSGQETLAHVWELRPDLAVVLSSGYSESECRELFRNQRIAGFLQKPYTAGRLADAVASALRARQPAGRLTS